MPEPQTTTDNHPADLDDPISESLRNYFVEPPWLPRTTTHLALLHPAAESRHYHEALVFALVQLDNRMDDLCNVRRDLDFEYEHDAEVGRFLTGWSRVVHAILPPMARLTRRMMEGQDERVENWRACAVQVGIALDTAQALIEEGLGPD